MNTSTAARMLAQGEALVRHGRWQEAEQLLRQCLAQEGFDFGIVALLVRTLLAQGRARDGHDLLNRYGLATASASPPVRLLCAQVLLEMGALKEAIAALREVVAAVPDHGVAHIFLATALGQDGQSRAANAAAQAAIANGFDNAGSRSVLARSFYEMHHYDDAETHFRRALKYNPWDTATHSSLAELVWMRTHDVHAALAEIDHALDQSRDARAMGLYLVRVRLLSAAGQRSQAMEELERLISSHPDDLPLRVAATRTCIQHDPSRAAHHATHAMRLAPDDAGVKGLYGDAMLATGRAELAADIAQRLLAGNPHDNHALALQSASWRMLEDVRHRPFHDYASLVQACMMDVPDGWSSLDHYLADLADDLHREHGLLAEPVDQSVRQGTQVEHRLTETPMRAVRALPQAIHGPINRYILRLRGGGTPWHRRATQSYRLNGLWSVRLRPEGHHVSHFHGRGWISSACYVQMPKAIAQGGQGWLKFGEPGVPAGPALGADYFLRPVPGLIVLFPSWMWHGTVPFTSATGEHRLTMAFDVLPSAADGVDTP